jgi:3-keto-disaccharide hydrolase
MEGLLTAFLNRRSALVIHTAPRNRQRFRSALPQVLFSPSRAPWILAGFLAACLPGIFLLPAACAADNVAPQGYVLLFNGKDLSGWKIPEGDGGHWKVLNGVIDYDAESQAKGDKGLWTDRAYGDFVLQVDWRLKEAPFINPEIPYILPDGSHARDIYGKEMTLSLPDSDSGILLRGQAKSQINIWCWPIGSGEIYGYRMDPKQPPEVRAGATPRTQADKPVGEWNHYEITLIGDRVTVLLNGKKVLDATQMPGVPAEGPIGLQHHGSKENGKWTGPPSLVQFKNIYIKELGK